MLTALHQCDLYCLRLQLHTASSGFPAQNIRHHKLKTVTTTQFEDKKQTFSDVLPILQVES